MIAGAFDRDSVGAALRSRADRGPIGRRIEYFDRIGSTNDRARDLAASGEPEGTVVIAGEQTRGRGRSHRSWHSPPGVGLYLSAILRPPGPPSAAPGLGMVAAVAAATALERLAPIAVAIKWPNDVILMGDPPRREGRKVCGVLSEARTSTDAIRDVVIGIGVNVNQQPSDFPDDIAPRATSLRAARGEPIPREEAAIEVLAALDTWYTLWCREGMGPVIEAYRALAIDLEGRRVRVTGEGRDWIGTTAGLDDDGALRVVPGDAGQATAAAVPVRYGDVLRLEDA